MASAQGSGNLDFTLALPHPGEGSANEAIRALLDDARRAMDERRHQEFNRSLNFLMQLVTIAMDEMEDMGIEWGAPGSQPYWPPLSELDNNLYPFREEVIRRGDLHHISQLLGLDYWIVHTGIQRSCAELLTVGLAGYRRNYEIASRIGG